MKKKICFSSIFLQNPIRGANNNSDLSFLIRHSYLKYETNLKDVQSVCVCPLMDWKCVQGIFQTLETLLRYGVGKTNSWVHHGDFFILFVSRSGESERKLYQAGSDFLCGLCAPTLLRRFRLHGSHCSWSPMVMAACCGPCGSLSTNGTMHSQPPSD